MSRHENEKLDFELPDPLQITVVGFTTGAETCEEDSQKCYAKRVMKQRGSEVSTTYHLKFGRGRIFDPWGTHSGREKSADLEWKKVASTVFDKYYKYLATRNTRHLTLAERMIIDDHKA
jgi:hypothetical protein|tara:strand:- start:4834 stop:5190 length:357 start_codon:yes stop_codon:yes gene_type:complete